ncbi:hypothetical protein E4T43_01667 [Aureobasidium subglaciale]|nr:hypothetical protein E4T43_01667 [Aureobasidium subglaciale]
MLCQAGPTEIIIDALDESSEVKDTTSWLERLPLNRTTTQHKSKVIITSRNEHDIESALIKWLPDGNILCIEESDVQGDIREFVRSQVQLHPGLVRWTSRRDVQQEIESKLIEKAGGMFRWVACQLDTLDHCLTLVDLRKALNNLPAGLDETYSRILARIEPNNQESAIAMLQLLLWAEKEISLDQLVDALAVRQSELGLVYDPDNKMPLLEAHVAIVDMGMSLFTFLGGWIRGLVLQGWFGDSPWFEEDSWQDFDPWALPKHWPLLHEVPFLFYLEDTWDAHVGIAQHNKGSLERIVDFLRNEQVPGNPFAICTRFTNRYCAEPKTEPTNPLDYAINSGFDDIVLRLLEHDVRAIEITPDELSGGLEIAVNTLCLLEKNLGSIYRLGSPEPEIMDPPTQVLALPRYRVIHGLLERGAKPSLRSLVYAVSNRKDQLVQILLDKDAPLQDTRWSSMVRRGEGHAFAWDSTWDREEPSLSTIHHLLPPDGLLFLIEAYFECDHVADGRNACILFCLPLHVAISRGADFLIRLLLRHGADVNLPNPVGCTPLMHAAHTTTLIPENHVLRIIQTLLDSDADMNVKDYCGNTALHAATENYFLSSETITVLLRNGANPCIRNDKGLTALDMVRNKDDEDDDHLILLLLLQAMWAQKASTQMTALKSKKKRPRGLLHAKSSPSRKTKPSGRQPALMIFDDKMMRCGKARLYAPSDPIKIVIPVTGEGDEFHEMLKRHADQAEENPLF